MKDYHINIFYSEQDCGYIADIPDLAACSAFGAIPEDAVVYPDSIAHLTQPAGFPAWRRIEDAVGYRQMATSLRPQEVLHCFNGDTLHCYVGPAPEVNPYVNLCDTRGFLLCGSE